VIDPPSLPLRPFWPNRLSFSWLGLFVGLVLAVAITAGLELAHNPVRGDREVASMLPVPILAGIPLIVSQSQKQALRRRMWIEIAAASAMFVVIVAGNFLSYYRG